jgi:hypothetical protein
MRLFDIVRGFREEFDIYAGDSNYYAFVADAFMKNIRTIGITDASEVFSRKAEAVRENTWKAFAAMSKFWNAYSTYAPQDEGGFFYTEALSEYLKAAFLNRPPRVFMQVAAELDKKGRELKDPKRLVEWAMALDKLQSDYLALKEKAHGGSKKVKLFKKDGEGFSLRTVGLKIPGGSKRVLVLNKGTNKIELQEVDSGYKYEKEGAYAPLVSTRPGNDVKIFYQNIYEFAPWLANLGRIHLAEAVSKAEALLNEKGMNMQIDGMEDVPITRVISKKMIMAIIYTEREPVTLSSVKTRKDFLDYASNVDIIIALKGDNAYVDDVSNVSASGIAQLMPGTYDDINAFFPKKKISEILPSSYEEVIVRMDYSIVTMYLVLERMAEIIAYHNKKKENWTSDDARNFFLNSSKRQAALAIAYNQGGSLPMKYAHSGKASLLTGYAKAVQNVLRFLIPV